MFQTSGEIGGGGAGGEVAVGIVSMWQPNQVCRDADALQVLRKLARSLLAGMVFILVKDDVYRTVW